MNGYEHLVWAPACVTVAYLGHSVAMRWMNTRERAAVAAEQRNERETGAAVQLATIERQMGELRTQVNTFIANHRSAR